jgi:hypothetical protein
VDDQVSTYLKIIIIKNIYIIHFEKTLLPRCNGFFGKKIAPSLSYLEGKKPLNFAIFRHYLLACSQNIKGFLKALNSLSD